MFINLIYEGGGWYRLYDSQFTVRFDMDVGTKTIIEHYNVYNTSPLQALKAYICERSKLADARADLEYILSHSITYFPHLKFKEKYYPCLLNHWKKLTWLGKMPKT